MRTGCRCLDLLQSGFYALKIVPRIDQYITVSGMYDTEVGGAVSNKCIDTISEFYTLPFYRMMPQLLFFLGCKMTGCSDHHKNTDYAISYHLH